jgi:hypothetical protein
MGSDILKQLYFWFQRARVCCFDSGAWVASLCKGSPHPTRYLSWCYCLIRTRLIGLLASPSFTTSRHASSSAWKTSTPPALGLACQQRSAPPPLFWCVCKALWESYCRASWWVLAQGISTSIANSVQDVMIIQFNCITDTAQRRYNNNNNNTIIIIMGKVKLLSITMF